MLSPTLPSPQGQDIGRNIGENIAKEVTDNVLRGVRGALREELKSLRAQHDKLVTQLAANPSDAEAAGLRNRLARNQSEMAKVEAKITDLSARMGEAVPTTPSLSQPDPFQSPHDPPVGMIVPVVAIVFVGFPLALAFARLLWRRASQGPPAPTALSADSSRRFDQLEQSIDAIAIEVERISENQRYLTKVLSEPKPVHAVPAVGGDPKPH